jgi:hypothetical protein
VGFQGLGQPHPHVFSLAGFECFIALRVPLPIPALRRLGHEDHEFQTSLGYISLKTKKEERKEKKERKKEKEGREGERKEKNLFLLNKVVHCYLAWPSTKSQGMDKTHPSSLLQCSKASFHSNFQ